MLKDPALLIFLVLSGFSFFAWWLMIPGIILYIISIGERGYKEFIHKKDEKLEQRVRSLENQIASLMIGTGRRN